MTKDEIQKIAIMSEKDHKNIILKWTEECVTSIMRIGLSWSLRAHKERMPMNVVVTELQAIKSSYLKFKKARGSSHRHLFAKLVRQMIVFGQEQQVFVRIIHLLN